MGWCKWTKSINKCNYWYSPTTTPYNPLDYFGDESLNNLILTGDMLVDSLFLETKLESPILLIAVERSPTWLVLGLKTLLESTLIMDEVNIIFIYVLIKFIF